MLGLPQQQCWKDYPFAFDGGRKCCQYNSHTDESPLTIHSDTCKDDLYISCAKDECQDNGNNFELLIIIYSSNMPNLHTQKLLIRIHFYR